MANSGNRRAFARAAGAIIGSAIALGERFGALLKEFGGAAEVRSQVLKAG